MTTNNNSFTACLKYANLQMAAEAGFGVDVSTSTAVGDFKDITKVNGQLKDLLLTGNRRNSRFTDTLSDQFISDWEVVAHQPNTATGFSGTLFRCKTTDAERGLTAGELVLSFRSTEFVDDAARDTQVTNRSIYDFGWAFGQLSDMRDWWESLQADGTIDAAANVTVTGYSLGSHLAYGFNMLFESNVGKIYTFNGAGVGEVADGTTLSDVLDGFQSYWQGPNQADGGFTDPFVLQCYQEALADSSRESLHSIWTRVASAPGYIIADWDQVKLLERALTKAIGVHDEIERVTRVPGAAQIQAADNAGTNISYWVGTLRAAENTCSRHTSAPYTRHVENEDPRFSGKTFDIFGCDTANFWGNASVVANSQWHFGEDTPIYIEGQPLFRGSLYNAIEESFLYSDIKLLIPTFEEDDFGDTHSLVLLVDSLVVLDLMHQMAPVGSTNSFQDVLSAACNDKVNNELWDQGIAEGRTLETVVDALSKAILGTDPHLRDMENLNLGNTWHIVEQREELHKQVKTLVEAYQDNPSLRLRSLTDKGIDNIASLAQTEGVPGLAYRYALMEMNPFVVEGADYAPHNQDGRLDIYSAQGQGQITQQWISDRAEMLGWKMAYDYGNVEYDEEFEDSAVDEDIDYIAYGVKGNNDPLKLSIDGWKMVANNHHQQIVFGDDKSNHLIGKVKSDRLYGGDGDDILEGSVGGDYLEGGRGHDEYRIIDGYTYVDTIFDIDGRGSIVLGDTLLTGGKGQYSSIGKWVSEDARFQYEREGTTLKISDRGILRVRVLNYDFENGALGLTMTPDKLGWGDIAVLPKGGHRYDKVDLSDPVHSVDTGDLADYVTGTARDNQIFLGSGNDIAFGMGGKDYIEGDEGNDVIFGGPNFETHDEIAAQDQDYLIGGAGRDILVGGVGNDVIHCGNMYDHLLTENTTGETFGDWANGGEHNDDIFGSAANDLLQGGDGSDWIAGGTGDDVILGDGDYLQKTTYGRLGTALNIYHWKVMNGQLRGAANSPYGIELAIGANFKWSFSFNNQPRGDGISDTDFEIHLADGQEFSLMDRVAANGGDDQLFGGAGNDWIAGQTGSDLIDGEEGDDVIYGDDIGMDERLSGDDQLYGGLGADTLYGGFGDDILCASYANMYEDNAVDFLYGEAGNDTLMGNANDKLYGGTGNDFLIAHGEGAELYGEKGDDYFSFWGGVAKLDGGEGYDTYQITSQNLVHNAVTEIIDSDGRGQIVVDGVQVNENTMFATSPDAWLCKNGMFGVYAENSELVFVFFSEYFLNPGMEPLRGQVKVTGYSPGKLGIYLPEYQDPNDPGPVEPSPNRPPMAGPSVDNIELLQHETFTFKLSENLFSDPDGDTLTWSVMLANDDPLPGWMEFDPQTRVLSGIPANLGETSLKIIVTDSGGLSATQTVALKVNNSLLPNRAPTAGIALMDQQGEQDSAWQVTIPEGAFTDADGDALTYSATLSDGSPLPDWLSFDVASGSFSGTPGNSDVGILSLKITATDPSGLSASQSFELDIANINDTPEVGTVIGDQQTQAGQAWQYAIPSDAFIDIDVDDELTYSATLSDGGALPDWLSFDATTGTFTGTPPAGEAANLSLKVTATDLAGASVDQVFALSVEHDNHAPAAGAPIVAQQGEQDSAWQFSIPSDAFTDADGDALTYSATLADGGPLPGWLSFDAASGSFSGTPGNSEVGSLSLKVTATDPSGLSASQSFALEIANINDAPEVGAIIGDQQTQAGQAWQYAIPSDAFIDIDVDDVLTYSATLSDGGALPAWLSFDAATGTFTGTPPVSEAANLSLKVTATDLAGASVDQMFGLSVTDQPTYRELIGTEGADSLSASARPDLPYLILGNGGNDTLRGSPLNDTLRGGAGNDNLDGRGGDDLYLFGRGDGQDTIYNWDNTPGRMDILRFEGVSSDEIKLVKWKTDLEVSIIGTSDKVVVSDYFNEDTMAYRQLNYLEFADGVRWDAGTVTSLVVDKSYYELVGTEGDDNLKTPLRTDLPYLILGNGGNDTLRGSSLNDTLHGGSGNDELDAGLGDDVYLFGRGDGQDTIYNWDDAPGRVDILRFIGLNADEIRFTRKEGSLEASIIGTDDKVVVNSYFNESYKAYRQLNYLEFADGTQWDVSAVTAAANANIPYEELIGTEGDDNLRAPLNADARYFIIGNGGNDTLRGGPLNDTLHGGGGNDNLDAGLGDDVYLFGRGDGQDTIYNWDNTPGRVDILHFDSVNADEIRLIRNGTNLEAIISGTADKVVVVDYFSETYATYRQLNYLEFADGTRWDADTVTAAVEAIPYQTLVGTDGNDNLRVPSNSNIPYLIIGNGGNDTLRGGLLNDTLHGGSGNDDMDAGLGNDVYLFGRGDGQDTIYNWDNTPGRIDILRFDGVNADEVTLKRVGTNLEASIVGTDDKVIIYDHFGETNGAYRQLDYLEFADGSKWDRTAINQRLAQGDAGIEGGTWQSEGFDVNAMMMSSGGGVDSDAPEGAAGLRRPVIIDDTQPFSGWQGLRKPALIDDVNLSSRYQVQGLIEAMAAFSAPEAAASASTAISPQFLDRREALLAVNLS